MLLLLILLCLFYWHIIKHDKDLLITELTRAEKIYLVANVIIAYFFGIVFIYRGLIWQGIFVACAFPYMIMMAIMDHRTRLVYPYFAVLYIVLAEVVCVLEFSKFSISLLLIPIVFYIIHKLHLFEAGDISIVSVGTFLFFLLAEDWYSRMLMVMCMFLFSGIFFICENFIRKNITGFLRLKAPSAFSPALLLGTELVLFFYL